MSARELLWGWVRLLVVLDGTMWVGDGLSARGGDGGWRREGEMRGSRDGGGSGPIYRREGVEAKLKGAWGDRTGRDALGGEVSAGGVGAAHSGRRVAVPRGQGHV